MPEELSLRRNHVLLAKFYHTMPSSSSRSARLDGPTVLGASQKLRMPFCLGGLVTRALLLWGSILGPLAFGDFHTQATNY